jgi:2'-5' RNA ligase
MRLFIAVIPSPEAQAAAHAAGARLRHAGDGVSWVKSENLHYTLRFLGEVGEDGARRAGEAAHAAAARHSPFEASLGALGAFPDAARARVIWAGLSEGAEPLRALARSLDQALQARGFGHEERPFTPHLTLGRVRAGGDWTAQLAAAATPEARFRIERIVLVQSTLSPGGSRYDERAVAPLSL